MSALPEYDISSSSVATPNGGIAGNGVALLVIDCNRIKHENLSSAVQLCRQIAYRMDILMVSAPNEPMHLLSKFLKKLESVGVDYRLTRAEGGLEDETLRYVRTRRRFSVVLFGASQEHASSLDSTFGKLREMGYPVGVLMT